MTWSPKGHSSAGGANGATTTGIDTTGADFLIASVTGRGPPTLSDNMGNSWTGLTSYSDGTQFVRLYYSIPTAVGLGHTFTVAGASSFSAVAVDAYSGALQSSPFDVENGASTNTQPNTSGSITPNQANSLIVSGICAVDANYGGLTPSVSPSPLVRDDGLPRSGGVNFGNFIASGAQTTVAAINAAWDFGLAGTAIANIAAFKPAGAATNRPVKMVGRWGGYAGASGGFAA